MTTKVYIAGPMTGYERFNFDAFDTAAYTLRKQGKEVFSPADHDRELLGKSRDWVPSVSDSEGPWLKWGIPNAPTLRTMLGDDLRWIAQHADALHMLKGWEKSRGAITEHALGVALGLEITYA